MGERQNRFSGKRREFMQRFFPEGIPTLWCPLLTHYSDDGSIDRLRTRAHLRHMQPWVKGFLVPGTTGDGWELTDAEARGLLDFILGEIATVGAQLLIGILKTDAKGMQEAMLDALAWLKQRSGSGDALDSLKKSSVCGFTVCPPLGRELSQDDIRTSLEAVLNLGPPTALYQLPQVTQNEMSPETVSALANGFDNFYLLKDTSGADRVALAGFRDVFLVRGAEGNYASHMIEGGGCYDGFLLSTANCFGRELGTMIDNIRSGNSEEAMGFSDKLTRLFDEVFALVAELPDGNPFANANKAIDHFFAHGRDAARVSPPRLHSGTRLPEEVIEAVGAALMRSGLMPAQGYLR